MNSDFKVTIFTDGSSRGNPGPGGYAAVIAFSLELGAVREDTIQIKELGGSEIHTTNNRMELMAVIQALSFLKSSKLSASSSKLLIYCDSSYVINGITKWIFAWQNNNWLTKAKEEVQNRDLWEKLASLVSNFSIVWKQVGGHVGVRGNERCDEIATAFALGDKPELYSDVLENYRIKNILNIEENSLARSQKNKSSSHSKAKAYSYVSLVDGKILVHKTWGDCEARVKGKKARYKKAISVEEETSIIKDFQS